MAVGRNNLSRRTLLGAALSTPALLGGGLAAEVGDFRIADRPQEWLQALAAYRRANASFERFAADRLAPAVRAHQELRRQWPLGYDVRADPVASAALKAAFAIVSPLEDEAGELESERLEAMRCLLTCSAPDIPAIAMKIALIVDHEAATLRDADEFMTVVKEDAQRLLA
jgi:hypothetical protein